MAADLRLVYPGIKHPGVARGEGATWKCPGDCLTRRLTEAAPKSGGDRSGVRYFLQAYIAKHVSEG